MDAAQQRQNVSGRSPWETSVGDSRAVRVGRLVQVAGTAALCGGEVACVGDLAGQTRVILVLIAGALAQAGASLHDVTRTRLYLTDMAHWEAARRIHGEVFGEIRPAATLVQVAALIDPRLLVETRAEA